MHTKYRRSDLGKIGSAIRSPHAHQRRVGYSLRDGKLTITGVVESYYVKQMTQESLRDVEGVEEVDNQLHVNWD